MGKTHADIPGAGRHGFIENDGKFHDRPQAAKVANKAKQTKTKVRKLHSTDLKKYHAK